MSLSSLIDFPCFEKKWKEAYEIAMLSVCQPVCQVVCVSHLYFMLFRLMKSSCLAV
jgi:hypothetical protein